jgi:hypothetical protein
MHKMLAGVRRVGAEDPPRLLRRARLANRPASLELISAKTAIDRNDRAGDATSHRRGEEHGRIAMIRDQLEKYRDARLLPR